MRREGASLRHNEVLNEIARRHGWKDWSLLQGGVLKPCNEVVSIRYRALSSRGSVEFAVELVAESGAVPHIAEWGQVSFLIPQMDGWRFISTDSQRESLFLYMDRKTGTTRARFVGGRWTALLSMCGVQQWEQADFLQRSLHKMLASLQANAVNAVLRFAPDREAGAVRLFYSRGPLSDQVLGERGYASVADAKAEDRLPDGAVRIGISHSGGEWVAFREPYGWDDE